MNSRSKQTYFITNYDNFRWTREAKARPGFRKAQIGALHAIGAHFSQRKDRAIITMPTGSGKTAVLCATPFILEAKRVLVITPSRLVREQIVEDFEQLETLISLSALDASIQRPRVLNAKGRIRSASDWNNLKNFDVIVGTPHSLSPGSHNIPEPPTDLFDLVLVDEAHHSPAATWAALLSHFSESKQVLFTATPFRADQREIKGRFAYTYDLRDAFKDGVYGTLEYIPITPAPGANPDVAIAVATERTFRQDRKAKKKHLVMVRTATKSRAKQLKSIYETKTALRLEVVTGNNSLRSVRGVLRKLNNEELDGIICVDMFGEGFNLPSLKIAALHSPHKSLSVTLQFIGRFARTTSPQLGRAAFLALASDMRIEREHLYEEGAIWQDIIPDLSAARIADEQATQEVLQSFESGAGDFTDVPDLSLYSLQPYFHVKVLNTGSDIDVLSNIDMPGADEIVYRFHSREHQTALYIVKRRARPRWTTASHLDSISYELYILHLHQQSGYLFICSSRRDNDTYRHFAVRFATGGVEPRGLSSSVVQRALGGIDDLRFFNIGMRNAAATDRDASYVTMAGSAVDNALQQNDGRRYNRGHYFAKGRENNRDITLGVSTGSKFWSNASDRLPALIRWCDSVAEKLWRGVAPQTHTGIDHLGYGQSIEKLPSDIIAVDWDRTAYTHPRRIEFTTQSGTTGVAQLLDLEFVVERNRTSGNSVGLLLRLDSYEYRMTFSYDGQKLIEPDDIKSEPILYRSDRTELLTEYLNEHYPCLYTASFSHVVAGDLYELSTDATVSFDAGRVDIEDWQTLRVDIGHEVGPDRATGRSIHSWLQDSLQNSQVEVVFYDHGQNEMADFITIGREADKVVVTFYHCKSSMRPAAGSRVDDFYDVCGQAIKSKNWDNMSRLCDNIEQRARSRPQQSHFLKGDQNALNNVMRELSPISFQIVIVQPGLSRASLSPEVARLLAATDQFVFGQRWRRIKVVASP